MYKAYISCKFYKCFCFDYYEKKNNVRKEILIQI